MGIVYRLVENIMIMKRVIEERETNCESYAQREREESKSGMDDWTNIWTVVSTDFLIMEILQS